MDFYQKNKQALVEYFQSGCARSGEPRKLGIELEHFLLDERGQAVQFLGGAERLLEACARRWTGQRRFSEGHLIGLTCEGFSCECALSLEPGSQFETSIGPSSEIREIAATYDGFMKEARVLAQGLGYRMENEGYHPTARAEEIVILPKERYRIMHGHFEETGKHGVNMMRATASTQVSLGYSSEEEAERLFSWASAVTPALALLSDNAAVYEGAPYQGRLLRAKIWADVDKERCGFAGLPETGEGFFARYAEYILNVPLLLVLDGEGNGVSVGNKTVAEVYCDRVMTEEEINHALSMVFPHVRLRTYVEIRLMDSVPRDFALGLLALVSGSAELSRWAYRGVREAEAELERAENATADVSAEYKILDEMLCEAEKSPAAAYLGVVAGCVRNRLCARDLFGGAI